ncbi:MAG: glycosyltransferase, partial [Gammaproteobacteria bacterium]|nr:glycosyltransferase [Gammaproteobacteria bacterium]
MSSVSVVIPSFNRVETLQRALASVLSQTRVADEVIVVDDGSTDSTAEMIINNFPDVVYLYQTNRGVSAARNLGITHASSDWIALLDSDDEWLPEKLQRQLALLENSPELSNELKVCHTEEIWVRNGKRVNQMKKHEKAGGWIYQRCLPICAMSPSSIVIHRAVFEKVGLFDEDLPACEDYDLWLKICSRYPVAYIEEPQIVKYGGHEDQLSRRYWGMDRFRVKSLLHILNEDQ